MDNATEDLYLQKIHEFVFDEDKIVTCVSIASDLNISIQDAKNLITTFVNDCRQIKSTDLALTYWISGNLKNNKGISVNLVEEGKLDSSRELFESITIETIYSVQKSKNIDFNTIAVVDKIKNLQESPILGSITSKNCIKRNVNEKKSVPVQQIENQTIFPKLKPKIEDKNEAGNSKPASRIKQPSSANHKGGIASFFNKVPAKSEQSKVAEDKNSEELVVKGSLNGVKVEEKNAEINGANCNDKLIKNEKMDVDGEGEEQKPVVASGKKKSSKKRQRKEIKENGQGQPTKRRRRIEDRFDSDSSDMFGSEDNEDIIEKSDSEPEPIPVVKPPLAPKNKRRKAVDKTYQDEEGYIVTKTEYIYETASEDEKEEEKPKVEEKNTKIVLRKNTSTDSENDNAKNTGAKGKKNKKAVSGKQPTLLNFFKRS